MNRINDFFGEKTILEVQIFDRDNSEARFLDDIDGVFFENGCVVLQLTTGGYKSLTYFPLASVAEIRVIEWSDDGAD